jgi:hypothetical protein
LGTIVTAREDHRVELIELAFQPLFRNRATRWRERRFEISIGIGCGLANAPMEGRWQSIGREYEFHRNIVADVANAPIDGSALW